MTKRQENSMLKAQNARLIKMLEEERQKVSGYKELSHIQNAYIAIALNRMGATAENPVPIINTEVTEAMERYEVRAVIGEDGGFKFYCEDMHSKCINE